MTAFLKIDTCNRCRRALPWEWVPAVHLGGKALAGTGIWRSALTQGSCSACLAAVEARREKEKHAAARKAELIQVLGGSKPYRAFTFERYQRTPENERAFTRCKGFNPASENLYLWGSCGVGKTHLSWASARRAFEETLSVRILRDGQITRAARMKDPNDEQAVIDNWIRADVLVVDDVGAGPVTPFYRQLVQEILDGRDFRDAGGLVVTSKYSLGALAFKLGDDSIASRLAGLCTAIEVKGPDRRLERAGS